MAKVLFTAVVADMRNKLNGTVFSKNRYGAYTRTKVTPVNRRSDAQQKQRVQLGNLSSSWRNLTQFQRNGWNSAAGDFPRTDIFGNKKVLSGQALFVGLNTNLLNVGQPIIEDVPAPESMPDFAIVDSQFILDTELGEFTASVLLGSALPTGFKALFYVTPPASAGREFFNNYKLLSPGSPIVPTGTPATIYDMQSQIANVVGVPPLNSKMGLRMVVVNTKTGEASAPLDISVLVKAG